jgi:hypothetical protein
MTAGLARTGKIAGFRPRCKQFEDYHEINFDSGVNYFTPLDRCLSYFYRAWTDGLPMRKTCTFDWRVVSWLR